MKAIPVLTLVFAFTLASCAMQKMPDGFHDGQPDDTSNSGPDTKPPVAPGEMAAVTFIPQDAAYNEFRKTKLKGANNSDPALVFLSKNDVENKIDQICGAPVSAPEAPNKAMAAILIADLIQDVGNWVVKKADSALQSALKKYSATVTGKSDAIDFYDSLGGKNGLVTNKDMCFRFTQIGLSDPKDPKSAQTVLVDFVGSVKYDGGNRDWVTLIPLRVYVQRLDVPSEDNKVALGFTFSGDVTQRLQTQVVSTNAVMSALVGTATFDKTKISANSSYSYHLFDAKDSSNQDLTPVMLPPWDYDPSFYVPTVSVAMPKPNDTSSNPTVVMKAPSLIIPKHNQLVGKVTMTEVGHAPAILAWAAKTFDDNKDSASKGLIKELDKRAGVPSN